MGRSRSRSRSRARGGYGGGGGGAARPPPDTDHLFSLKIDDLDYDVTEQEIEKKFAHYGDIGDIYLPVDKYNRDRDGNPKHRGFAFVRYKNRDDMEDAIEGLNDKKLGNRRMRVSEAPPKRSGPPARSYDQRRRDEMPRNRSRSRSRSRSRGRYRSRSR